MLIRGEAWRNFGPHPFLWSW